MLRNLQNKYYALFFKHPVQRAENVITNKKLKDEVSSAIANMNAEFVGLDDKVNDKIEAAEKRIKNGFNDGFKEIFNDTSVDKKLENLTKCKRFENKE